MGATSKHRPDDSGYEEAQPTDVARSARGRPDPDAAGNQRAQVASAQHSTPADPGPEPPLKPEDDEPLPPGEHKREPIHDPDPADTKLHVQQSSR
jgi:hypothetical protein